MTAKEALDVFGNIRFTLSNYPHLEIVDHPHKGERRGERMNADKMLAELGYIKIANDGKTMIYQKRFDNEHYIFTKTITFYTRDNDISLEVYLEDEPLEMVLLSFAELQAIMAKIKELG